jgi:hypothetical protein
MRPYITIAIRDAGPSKKVVDARDKRGHDMERFPFVILEYLHESCSSQQTTRGSR